MIYAPLSFELKNCKEWKKMKKFDGTETGGTKVIVHIFDIETLESELKTQ